MSVWSYVKGVIEVDTFARSDAEAMFLAQTVVNHLPKIYGSEESAKYYLNRPVDYGGSSSEDEFGVESNLMQGENCWGTFEVQSRILITLEGQLRDVEFEEALRNTTKMLARLSSRLWVKSCLVSVESRGRRFVFVDPEWVADRDLSGWTDRIRWKEKD